MIFKERSAFFYLTSYITPRKRISWKWRNRCQLCMWN